MCVFLFISSVTKYDGKQIIEMGFGRVNHGGPFSNELRTASAFVMPNSQCIDTYGRELLQEDLCTYSSDRNDTCQV